MIMVLNGTHFTMQFETYIQDPVTEKIINSYAFSPEVSLEEFVNLVKDYTIEKIIFVGQIKIFKEIEKYYEMNYTEVKIIWL